MYGVSFYQNMLTVIIIIVSFIIVCLIGCRRRSDFITVTTIFLWHILFSITYYLYSLFNVADATHYYSSSVIGERTYFYPGTPFVNYFSSMLSQGADASYLNTTLLYNLLGTLGLVLLYLSLKKYLKVFSWYWIFILFIPSMSFWSAGLGKDAVSFFATCLFLYSITTSKKASLLIAISFFFMFMVRPHIAFIMLVSYIIYFIIKSKVNFIFKLFFLPVIGICVFLSVDFVQQYVGLDEVSLEGVSGYIDGRQGLNSKGGSSLDISSMSYPMQMFTYVFRPLPFEASSVVALVTSLENIIILFLFIYILLKSKFNFRPFIQGKNLWLFTYVFLTCSILAMTTANLGIATRQKWMFMPVLLYLLIYAFHNYKVNKSKVYQ
ncbi:hypothetical protein [Psychrobacter sp. NG27]|uniref:hypothetical protein n=1 Tax=Psychrobacter sp. NG27 TaxID=2781966 RepID=UPI0018DF8B88|nr:hypothetical protein [Psychrobacter sp. NG27]MBI0425628.1 hypothetical protein [Psychrobacter sp. NG27]